MDQTEAPNMLEILKAYQSVKSSKRLLSVEYVFLQEYLYLLRAAAEALHFAGVKAMFYLAAAVSDFYIPVHDMVSTIYYRFAPCRKFYCIQYYN